MDKVYQCSHPDDRRCLTGTWCNPEFDKAVAMGYEIQHIHEVWHFPKSKVGLFQEYVDTWLKLNVEANGWPPDCDTEDQRRDYVARFKAHEGILIDYDNIEYNPGLGALAKMMLASMWGRFGQRLDKTQVTKFTGPQTFCEFKESDQREVRCVSVLTEHRVPLHDPEGGHPRSTQPQPLRGLLHHLLGASPNLRSPGSPGRSRAVLRHRFRRL